MSKRYLVTGGTGFLGSAIVRRLVTEGHEVTVLDNNSRGAARRIGDLILKESRLVESDVRDVAAVTSASRGVDAIVHLAAINGTEFFYSKPELVLDVALRGTLAVIDACRANDVGDLILASSSEVYATPRHVPTDEFVALTVPDVHNPRYSYGGGKIVSELIAMNYGRTGFDRVTIFRPHNVYGIDMGWEHVIPQLVLKAAAAANQTKDGPVPLSIQGDGSQTRAFVHIDDMTDGLMSILEKGRHLEIYHVGNPEETTIAELSAKIMLAFGREVMLITSDPVPGGTPRRCPDISKLRKLGYEPKISLDEGLPEVVKWYAANSNLRTRNKIEETEARP